MFFYVWVVFMSVCMYVTGQEVEEEPMLTYEAAMKEISISELARGICK